MYGRSDKVDKVVFDKDEITESSIIKDEKEPLLIIKQNDIFFSLNEDSKTANIVRNFFIKGDLFIEKSIKYNDQEFIITRIKKGAFKEANINSIQFSPDSELKIIEKDAFKSSTVRGCVKIPSSVKYIGKFAFDSTRIDSLEIQYKPDPLTIDECAFPYSINCVMMPSNVILKEGCFNYSFDYFQIVKKEQENVKLYDDNILISKSNINSNEFDVIIVSKRDIKTLTIPPFIKIIGDNAFNSSKLESIIIPSQVERIGYKTFSDCKNIKTFEIALDSQINVIKSYAFRSSSIESITIPPKVKVIENDTFYYCQKLIKVKFAQNSQLQIIESGAFSCTKIESITIPSHVTKICSEAFFASLNHIEFAPNSELQIIEEGAFKFSKMTSITIPSGVKRINTNTFFDCKNLKNVKFAPNSELQTIEKDAFAKSPIETISLPSSVVELKDGWNDEMPKLTNIEIMINKEQNISCYNDEFIIGKSDIDSNEFDVLIFFKKNENTKITIPPFIKKIASYVFENSLIEEITIPSQVREISEGAFYGCKHLTNVFFAEDSELSIIGEYAFSYTPINNIAIPRKVKEICSKAFLSCKKLEKVDFIEGSELTTIGSSSFSYSLIKSIAIPPKVKIICSEAFFKCEYLQIFDAPINSELQTFEQNVFQWSKITSITIPPYFVEFKDFWCQDTPDLTEIKLIGNNPLYKSYSNKYILGKSDINNDVYDVLIFVSRDIEEAIIPPSVKKIANHAFANTKINKISIPSHVNEICNGSFSRCRYLQEIHIPNNSELKEIMTYSFFITSIKSISIPPGVRKFCDNAFSACERLEYINIPVNSELHDIGQNAFFECKIKRIFLPRHLTLIHKKAFFGCEQLTLVEVAEDTELKSLNVNIFKHSKKAKLQVPAHVKTYEANVDF